MFCDAIPATGPALEQLSQLLIDEGRSQEAVKILPTPPEVPLLPKSTTSSATPTPKLRIIPKSEEAYRKAADEDPTIPAICTGSRRP